MSHQQDHLSQGQYPSVRPAFLTATELLDAYRSGALSPVDAVKDVLDRIEEVNCSVNAYCYVQDAEVLLLQAYESEERWYRVRSGEALENTLGLLEGVPVSVKDILTVKGMKRANFGSIAYSKYLDQYGMEYDVVDSPAVERMRQANAIIIGKVTSPEFGWEGITSSPLNGITRNPIARAFTAGGSSGGSSSAVALGMAPLSLGTDAGGSVRIPAAMAGISTIKATFAKVAHAPPSAFGTLSHVGPMCTSVADVALLLDAIAHPHLLDPYSLYPGCNTAGTGKNDFLESSKKGIAGMRIAASLTLGGYVPYVHKQIADSFLTSVEVLRKLGATVDLVDDMVDEHTGEKVLALPSFQVYRTFKTLWSTGAANLLSAKINAENLHLVDPGLREVAALGNEMSAVDMARAEFERTSLGRYMAYFHEKYDLLITPTLPLPPFRAELEVPENDPNFMEYLVAGQFQSQEKDKTTFRQSDRYRWWCWTPFTYPFNLTKQPAASVPCDFVELADDADREYLSPFAPGLHIVGRIWEEEKVLRAAYAFEQATGHQKKVLDHIRSLNK